MSELRIRVVATTDRSLGVAYQPLIAAAERARKKLQETGEAAGQATARGAKRGADEAAKEWNRALRDLEKLEREKARAIDKGARDRTRANERAAREAERFAQQESRARTRENDKIVRDAERAQAAQTRAAERGAAARARAEERALRTAQRESAATNRELGRSVASGAARGVGMATGVAKDLARGAGVQLDFASAVQANTSLEKNAVDLVNAGYMPGKAGPAGQRQSAAGLMQQVRQVSIATGSDSNDAMQGLQAFVGKTGDLQTGRDVLEQMAKLSKASGANIEDMAAAAGDVANALGDVPNKGEAVQAVMAAIAAQGKEGAVEIKDLATQMAKLGAASGQFSGNTTEVMSWMGALTQMTRARGGAASSTQAATALGSFTNTFSKGARRHAFAAEGVAIESGDGKIRNPRDIIIDALRATGGNTERMGKMFMDVNARRVTRGFETIYKEAGGGEKGIEAVRKAFDDLSGAVMTNKEVEESFAAAMKTSDAQAKVFNEQMRQVAGEIQSALTPALQAFAPALIAASRAASSLIGDLTGVDEKKRRTAEIGTEAGALNALGAVNDDLMGKRFDQGNVDAARTQRAALAAAIERKRADVDKVGESGARTGPGMWDANKKLREMTPEQLKFAASQSGGEGERASQFIADKQQLARMEGTLGQLDTTLQSAMTRALEGAIVDVRLTNDPTFARPPSIGPSGRMPSPDEPKK